MAPPSIRRNHSINYAFFWVLFSSFFSDSTAGDNKGIELLQDNSIESGDSFFNCILARFCNLLRGCGR
jgi:hypothetical protein